jgi:hydroxymethylglutaryl-CoA lyase
MNSPRVEIVEVGPRDGLQSEAQVLPTDRKVEFVRRLVAAGLRRIEVASFVNPKRVPQMADAEAVLAALGGDPAGGRFIGLVLNRKGFDRARAAGCT